MTICKTTRLICLSALLFTASASWGIENELQKRLGSLGEHLLPEQAVRVELLEAAEYGIGEAIAVKTSAGVCRVLFMERYPESITDAEKREFLEMQGINALVKHLAVNSNAVRDSFSEYAYKDILLEYAGRRLIYHVNGHVDMKGVSIDYASQGGYFAVLIQAPCSVVDTKAVSIVSSDDARRYYIVALLDRVNAAMDGQRFELAAKLLLEARKRGHAAKDLFLDLYTCYARTNEAVNLEKLTAYLLETKVDELTMNDCVRLARVAKQNSMKQQSRIWYLEAEARVNKGLQFNMLLPQQKEER